MTFELALLHQKLQREKTHLEDLKSRVKDKERIIKDVEERITQFNIDKQESK